jgi:hypothetical protein
MQKIYFDNNVARRLMDDPKSWNAIYDQLATRIGRRFQTVQSMYLFLEYLGFRKKQIAITPELMKVELSTAASFMSSDDLAQEIDDILEPNLKQINMEVKQQLSTLQSVFENLIKERNARTTLWAGSIQLIKALFGDFLNTVHDHYELFVEDLTRALVWDFLCCIESKGISNNLLRERQIGYWYQLHNGGHSLPMGKLIDDIHKYFKMDFSSFLKNKEDMVDSEMLTYAVLGQLENEKRIPIVCLTFDSSDTISERLKLALGCLNSFEETLGCNIAARPGWIYCLNSSDCQIVEVHEPLRSIFL